MEHSFVKVWLNRLGNKIYINNKDFFSINLQETIKYFKEAGALDKNGNVVPLQTYLNLGYELLDREELIETTNISYSDMKSKFSLTIYRIKCPPNKNWYHRQQYILFIGQKKQGITFTELPEGTFMSRGLKLEWDKLNQRIRGLGEGLGTIDGMYKIGDITPWINYSQEIKRGHNLKYLVKRKSYSEITSDLVNKWKGMPKQINYILKLKKVIPILITDEGYILCMPKPKKTDQLPRILIVGKSSRGKTFTLSSILGRVVYIFEHRVVVPNDSLNQFYDLSMPMDNNKFLLELKKIGNVGKYLPTINLYMSGPDVKIQYAEEQVGYRLVLSFKHFLENWDYYAKGIKKWDIGSPQKYLSDEIINKLARLNTKEKIRDYLFAKFTEVRGRTGKDGAKELEDGDKKMIMKWVGAIDYILREKFTSNIFLNEETTAPYWKLKTPTEELIAHPCIIAYEAGIIPVINNHLVKSRPITKKHMAWLLRKIVDWQMKRGKEKQHKVWIFADELRDFLERKGDELYSAFDYLFTQGRFNNIGACCSVQEYTKISKAMQANSTHLIIFELQTRAERKAVADDYKLDKEKLNSLADLKTFQCLFISKEKMVLYDKDGRVKIAKEGGMWRGKVIPPISTHKPPG
jgi:hypothetical protein